MGTFRPKYSQVVEGEYGFNSLPEADYKRFGVSMLGLGNVSKESGVTNALAAIFDLEGFTNFCNQLDPQLVVPEYLAEFLPWLFGAVAERCARERKDGRVQIWGSLPFFAKFTGDGVLFLWDTDLSKGPAGFGNIVQTLLIVCAEYEETFLKKYRGDHAKIPPRLRVGICRGQVLSIGDGNDYVGPSINMASRLQKIASLSFAVSRRGFDPKECFEPKTRELFLVKKIAVHGIGEDEPVVIMKSEFDALAEKDKPLFV